MRKEELLHSREGEKDRTLEGLSFAPDLLLLLHQLMTVRFSKASVSTM